MSHYTPTGLEAALLFLQLNGYNLVVPDDVLTHFILAVASAEYTLETVQDWLKIHIHTVI